MIRIGIIGMGVISHYYVKAFDQVAQCTLQAVCDLNPAKLAPHRANGVDCYHDYQQLLQSPLIDAVVINLPNNLHYQACLDALAAGKHVCCEKPLTLDLAQARALSRRAKELGLTLLTAFHRRYNQHLIAAVEQGVFASAQSITAHYDEKIEDHAGTDTWYLNPNACGGGCIADNGPNIFDSLSFALGELSLQHVSVRYNSAGVDMGAEISLRTRDGRAVSALLSWDYPDGERKDLIAHYADGSSQTVDMLAGSAGFKTSLYHEYEGVLRHLHRAVREQPEYGETGVDAVRLVSESYASLQVPGKAA